MLPQTSRNVLDGDDLRASEGGITAHTGRPSATPGLFPSTRSSSAARGTAHSEYDVKANEEPNSRVVSTSSRSEQANEGGIKDDDEQNEELSPAELLNTGSPRKKSSRGRAVSFTPSVVSGEGAPVDRASSDQGVEDDSRTDSSDEPSLPRPYYRTRERAPSPEFNGPPTQPHQADDVEPQGERVEPEDELDEAAVAGPGTEQPTVKNKIDWKEVLKYINWGLVTDAGYQIEDHVGHGGGGFVKKATKVLETGRVEDFAVKAVPFGTIEGHHLPAKSRAEREIEVHRLLAGDDPKKTHSNILPLVEVIKGTNVFCECSTDLTYSRASAHLYCTFSSSRSSSSSMWKCPRPAEQTPKACAHARA